MTNPAVLLSYLGLGVVMGGVSALFIRSLYAAEDFFENRVKGNYYTRHLLGMFLVGLMMQGLNVGYGHYYIEGVGYATVQDILSGTALPIFLLLLLFFLKLAATSLTLGSGASGGIFSPALFLGATVGGAFGIVLVKCFPGMGLTPAAFAVAGMAAAVGGTTGAAVTAIVMVFEMTLDYGVVLPMALTVAASYGVRKILCRESIYTLKLARRGHYIPEALQANLFYVRRAGNIMAAHLAELPAALPLEAAQGAIERSEPGTFVLATRDHQVVGVVPRETALKAKTELESGLPLEKIVTRDFGYVAEDESLFQMISGLRTAPHAYLLVVPKSAPREAASVKGVIAKDTLADVLVRASDLYSE